MEATKGKTSCSAATSWRALACDEGVVDADEIDRALRTLALPARITRPRELTRWVAGCPPLTDEQVGYAPSR